MKLKPKNIRHRLTLWYVLVSGLVLLFFIAGATLLQYVQLTRQLYHAEIQDLETAEGLLSFSPDGTLVLHEEYHNHPQSRLLLDRYMEVLTPRGELLLQNDKLKRQILGGAPFSGEGVSTYSQRRTRLSDGSDLLLISHIHSIGHTPLLIRLGYSLDPVKRRVEAFMFLLLLAVPLSLLFAGFIAYRMAVHVLEPLQSMASRAENINATQLHERLPVENPDDELGHMARVFNALLHRLEESFTSLKRFTADASHELRTPLASIRTVGEVGLQRTHSTEEYQDIIGSMLEEVGHLTQLVDSLLAIARADSGNVVLTRTNFPPLALAQEVLHLYEPLAEERGHSLAIEGACALEAYADRLVAQRAIANIVENAILYTRAGATIRIFLRDVDNASVEIAVEDNGEPIPASIRERLFDRFFRGDTARSQMAGGTGLGLSIALWAAEVNGGSLRLMSASRTGNTFAMTLPARLPCPQKGPR